MSRGGPARLLSQGDIVLYPEDRHFTPWQARTNVSHAVMYAGDVKLHSTTSNAAGCKGGVKEHRFNVELHQANPLEVLHCTNDTIRQKACEIAHVFAISPEYRQQHGLKHYLTSYAHPTDRRKKNAIHESKFSAAYAWLRGMRTLLKAKRGGKQSLSRLKGISCSQFVSYCLQAAIVHTYKDEIQDDFDPAVQKFLAMCERVLQHRIELGDGTKLNELFADNLHAIEMLDQDLKALMLEIPELKFLYLNPKGMHIDQLVEAVTAMPDCGIELRVVLPSLGAEDKVKFVHLPMEMVKAIPPDLWRELTFPLSFEQLVTVAELAHGAADENTNISPVAHRI